jgi:hypothetical protein
LKTAVCQVADARIQSAARGDQQQKAEAPLLIANANIAFLGIGIEVS